MSLLSDVARNVQVTKMSTNALVRAMFVPIASGALTRVQAVVFAPLLLRAPDESMTGMISDALPSQRVVRSMIDNYETLFKVLLRRVVIAVRVVETSPRVAARRR